MFDGDRRSPSTVPRYQRGGRTGLYDSTGNHRVIHEVGGDPGGQRHCRHRGWRRRYRCGGLARGHARCPGRGLAIGLGGWVADRRVAALVAVVQSFCEEASAYYRAREDGRIDDAEAREIAEAASRFFADLEAAGADIVCDGRNDVAALTNAALASTMGGTAADATDSDSFSATLRCHDANGEIHTLGISRSRVSLSSYEGDAIRAVVET